MRSLAIFVATAAVSATPIFDKIRQEIEFKEDLSCWQCLAGSYRYYLPNEEKFARLHGEGEGFCVKDLSEDDPKDDKTEKKPKRFIGRDWTYLDGAADNRDWALTACPSQASRCGRSDKVKLLSDEEKVISMEADEDLSNHCSWLIGTKCQAPGILPLEGEDDDWFLMYTEYSMNYTYTDGAFPVWPLEKNNEGFHQIPQQGQEEAYLGGELPMVIVEDIPMPGSQITQFFHYRNQVVDRENQFIREQNLRLHAFKDAYDAANEESRKDSEEEWFLKLLGDPFPRKIQAPLPYDLSPEYTNDWDLVNAGRKGQITHGEKAGLGQYTSGELIPSLGGKSFGVFGQGNPLKDLFGNPIEGSEVRQGSKLPQDGNCNHATISVTAIPKKAGAKMSLKVGAYPWGQVFSEKDRIRGTSWYMAENNEDY